MAKLNIFNFLKERTILVVVKEKLLPILAEKKDNLKNQLLSIIESKQDSYKQIAVDFILAHIELPLLLKPFKGIVRKALLKNADKLFEFIQIKIQEV